MRPSIWWKMQWARYEMASLRKTRPGRSRGWAVSGAPSADLDRRVCVRSRCRGFDEERVLHVAGRVLGREVQRREDVPVVLDFGAVGHGIACREKDLDDLVSDQRNRVARGGVRPSRRVQVARRGHLVGRGSSPAPRSDTLRCGAFESVELLAQFALELRATVLNSSISAVQFAFLAQNLIRTLRVRLLPSLELSTRRSSSLICRSYLVLISFLPTFGGHPLTLKL